MLSRHSILYLYFQIISFLISAQSAKIDTLLLYDSTHKVLKGYEIPVIKTSNPKVDKRINLSIKQSFLNDTSSNTKILDSLLEDWIDESLRYVQLQVTYNKNNVVSFQLQIESCGAYCSYWTNYFNYSLVTGHSLSIQSIIDTNGVLRKSIYKQKNKVYNEERKILKKQFLLDQIPSDTSGYELAMEYYDECQKGFNLKTFALYPDHIEFIDPCYFPQMIVSYKPDLELKYYYKSIRPYLKRKL